MSSKRSEQSGGQTASAPAQTNGRSSDSEPPPTTRLVFGLSSRTNKLKHDEYAAGRRSSAPDKKSELVESTNRLRDDMSLIGQSSAANGGPKQAISVPEKPKKTSSIRASKYGNFYKPQDLNSEADKQKENELKIAESAEVKKQIMGAQNRKKSPIRSAKEKCETSDSREFKPKMQFNIPPPRQVSTPSKSSVVSYAKSRIYDKPHRLILSNPPPPGSSSMLNTGAIPESILCGFKPPKQVNVSKARAKWEGGEPFAKCKSRQRLAAQAGKKLLHGTWSMTSVVATQQLQFQQALAQSSSSNKLNLIKFDPSVKILTRGSVLERVQQFEKAPKESRSAGSDSSSEYSLSDDEEEEQKNNSLIEASIVIKSANQPDSTEPTSKQALYKSRVSSLQSISNAQQQAQLDLSKPMSPPISSLGAQNNKPISGQTQQGRRLSLRRRSSTVGNSNSASIPKFYHPNGKPNTYEIELQKKNIVACFDKFPERKALLTGPTYRRHFHSIALACNFSEYFKEPLYLYVKHKMFKSNLLHNNNNNSNSIISSNGNVSNYGRKQSSAGLIMANNSINAATTTTQLKPLLTRAISVDNSTVEKIQNQTYITCDQYLTCWRNIISSCFDTAARFVHLLTLGERNYLLPDDFVPMIQSIIEDHPGLKFLRAAPDFHMRYIQTVIARIYFSVNKSWTGKISICELRRSNLLAVLQVLSQEEDINQITDYFSYEHFYVIYCKFWNLDQDHDLFISKEDLARHNDAAISSRIIERIFMGIVSKQIQQSGKMSYTDFVWFLLAEEDKKHPRAIEYWFRLMDIDGDGYISMYEMEYFYYEQMKRLELMNIEALPFIDNACQILDLVNPKEKNKISLSDLKRTKMATIFFDTFINIEKYLEHESREFVSTRDVIQDGVIISDWDRYASEEYENLVTEETSV